MSGLTWFLKRGQNRGVIRPFSVSDLAGNWGDRGRDEKKGQGKFTSPRDRTRSKTTRSETNLAGSWSDPDPARMYFSALFNQKWSIFDHFFDHLVKNGHFWSGRSPAGRELSEPSQGKALAEVSGGGFSQKSTF